MRSNRIKKNVDGFIIAAGNQTRFEDGFPKALVSIEGIPLLIKNILTMVPFVDNIFIIANEKNFVDIAISVHDYFLRSATNFSTNIEIKPIESGFGCGDALKKSLGFSKKKLSIVIWGDSFQYDPYIYMKAVSEFKNSNYDILIPVTERNKAYVLLNTEKKEIKSIEFNSFRKGFQDLSFFIFKTKRMLKILNKYKYENNEFKFLDIFNKFKIKNKILEFFGYPRNSFNTKKELAIVSEDYKINENN